jgi:hypothetical protein
MCHQSVGLIASFIEKSGIPTICLSLLREITEKVRPPRALFVPFRTGYPLGEPHNADLQRRILRSAMAVLESDTSTPVLRSFE